MKGQLVVITIEKGKAKIKTYNITSDRIRIGRTEDNDVVVNTGYASHHHGYLQQVEGELYYVDLNSVNGTYCNDKLVEKSIEDNMRPVCLKNHANLFIGDFENKEGCYIYYSKDTGENIRWKVARRGEIGILNSNLPRAKVGIVNIYAVLKEQKENSPAKSSASNHHLKEEIVLDRHREKTQEDKKRNTSGTLVVISVDENKTSIEQFLLKANRISIGRKMETVNCEIQIKNAVISKEQAVIEKIDGTYYYTEKGSNRFSLIGTRKGKIPLHQRIQLYDRDIMSIGNIEERRAVILYFSTNMYDNYSWKMKKLRNETVTIGRNQNNFICLPQLSVSRCHAKISLKNNHRILKDTKSSNGVLLNQKILNHEMILQSGDEIDIVNNKIIYLGKYLLYAVPKKVAREQSASEKLRNSEKLERHSYKSGIEVELNHISRIVPCKSGTGINGGSKKYILQDVSLKIPAGQLVAILGGSGAGKTTFMNCVNGFEPATEGTVKINGKELYANYAALKSRIGYVPQQDIVHEELPLESMLRYVAKLRLPGDLSKEEINSKVEEVIHIVDLKPHAKTYIKKLSGGQKRRASIAVELLSDPELFFLDEPTSGLDPEAETNLMKRLRVLSSDRGKTVLVITHTLQNIHLFDKVIFLAPGGKLCFYGSPNEAMEFFHVDNLSDAYEKIGRDVDGYVNKYKNMKEEV